MATKTISQEAAWKLIDEALGENYIAAPADGTEVYTKTSDVPKGIKSLILFKEYHYMFMLEFQDNGKVVKTWEDPRNTEGVMKAFYDLRHEIISGEYTSPNGERTLYEEHEYIDLGLPSGLKWAKKDVGRYAWAETIGKESFSKSSARKRTKFSDIKGDLKMDAARVHWGGKWRTPTPDEFQELVDNCKWQWRGWGYLLTGPNGKQIYFSACGYNYSAWGPLNKKAEGYYWTTASKEGEDNATCLYFNKNERKLEWKESYMGMCVRPVFSDAESLPEVEEPEIPVKNPEDYNKGIVNKDGILMEKYIFEGDRHWSTGNRASAARKIKTGDYVELKFLGASEGKININTWNGVWEMDETITVMGENFYFEVVVNEKKAYYGKYADYRYIEESNTMGGGVRLEVTRTSISKYEALNAFNKFKDWLSDGAKDNNYWHGIYKKTEFPEEVSYGLPGEEVAAPITEAAWKVGDVIEEGDGVFSLDGIRYEVKKDYKYVDGKEKSFSVLKVLPLKGDPYAGKVTIPEVVTYHRRKLSVTEVEKGTFSNCPELTEITVPCTVSHFPYIEGSPKLERIIVAEGNPKYCALDGIVYAVNNSWGRNTGQEGYTELYCYPGAHGDDFVLPDFVDSIAAGAFDDCKTLKSIVLSDKVTRIPNYAFKDCKNLESVTWGAGLKWIENEAFENCTALKSVVFTDSIEHVSSSAFRGCTNIASITFAKGKYFDLYSLPNDQFPWGKGSFIVDGVCYRPEYDYKRENGAYLTVADFPKDEVAEADASVQTLSIPAKIEHYGFIYEVSDCRASFNQFPSLKRLELPATIKKIDIDKITSLQEVVVDEANTEFSTKDGLLYNKQGSVLVSVPRGRDVKKLVIPDGVEEIGVKACCGNPYVEEVVIPDSTTAIKKEAFACCSSLRDVHLGKGEKKICTESFAYTAIERFVLTPQTFLTQQKATWEGKTAFYGSKLKAFELEGEHEVYTVIDGVLYIKNSRGLILRLCPPAYEGHLQIPEGVIDIGMCACWGCTELTSVFIPDGIDTIRDDAFSGCTKLENVDFDGHIGKIGSWAFAGCKSLKEIDCIGAKEIEDTAFSGDKGLKLNLPFALEKNRSKYEQFMNR